MNETLTQTPHPPIASREEWLAARLKLLQEEKALTRQYDKNNAQRRRMPMVKVEKTYRFVGEEGEKTLLELFEGKRQLIIQHFMFDPTWDEGCQGCTSFVNALGRLTSLHNRDTRFVLVSRAPLAKLIAYKAKQGWTHPWYSSENSDFNYDYGATIDPNRGSVTYNFKTVEDLAKLDIPDERPGTSVFFQMDGEVYHTYSCYARSGERLSDSYSLLDLTPYGRQEDFEDSPAGWPQQPTYG